MPKKKAYKQPKKPLYHCQVMAVKKGTKIDLYAVTDIEHVFRPEGRVKKLTPTNKEIDQKWESFLEDLEIMLDSEDVKKKGKTYKCIPEFLCSGYRAMPRAGNSPMGFTLDDLETAKQTLKEIRENMVTMIFNDDRKNKTTKDPRDTRGVEWFLAGDWNDLDGFIQILKRMKIKKPSLIGQLIFCCWTWDDTQLMPRDGFTLIHDGHSTCRYDNESCDHHHKPADWNHIWQPMQGRFA